VKVGYVSLGHGIRGPKRGDAKHSAEGYWGGIHQALDNLARRASWHFTVGYDRTEQHYEVSAHTWHSGDVDDDGGVRGNVDLVGIEHLGMAGDPLTDYQVEMTERLSRWCAEQFGRDAKFTRYPDQSGWVLVEHNEVSDVPTACPSGRIPWARILRDLNLAPPPPPEEDDMALPFTVKLTTQETWLIGIGAPVRVTDPVALAELRDVGVVAPGPSIVVSKNALKQLGVPASDIP